METRVVHVTRRARPAFRGVGLAVPDSEEAGGRSALETDFTFWRTQFGEFRLSLFDHDDCDGDHCRIVRLPLRFPSASMPRLPRSVLPFSRRGCSQIIRHFSPARSIALFISLSGSVINLLLAFKCYTLWSALNGTEPESEWEGSLDSWSGESLTLLWGLLSCYFAAEAVSSFVGFIGIVKVRTTPPITLKQTSGRG